MKLTFEEVCRHASIMRQALESIVAMDYRGNEPGEQRIAREALAAVAKDGEDS